MDNVQTLKGLVLAQLPQPVNVSAWHHAILDEACETVILQAPNSPLPDLVLSASATFLAAVKIANAMIRGVLMDADTVTINYREQTFVFDAPQD